MKNEYKIDIPMTDAELAAIWNQHEYCPECKGTHIKNVSKRAKVSIFGFMWAHDVPEFLCDDCGCRCLTNEPSKHIKFNAWTGKRTEELKSSAALFMLPSLRPAQSLAIFYSLFFASTKA